MLEAKVCSWWKSLSQRERDILISVLYDLDLQDYVVIHKNGTYLVKKTT